MQQAKFTVTYEVFRHDGEFLGGGYIDRNDVPHRERQTVTLREAVALVEYVEDRGRRFREIGERAGSCLGIGNYEMRSLYHPGNITRASYKRLARLLTR